MFLGGQAIPGVGGKGPDASVMRRPALAFGCADGIVRIVQYDTYLPMTKLVSTHKSSIQCIATFQAKGSHWEQVCVHVLPVPLLSPLSPQILQFSHHRSQCLPLPTSISPPAFTPPLLGGGGALVWQLGLMGTLLTWPDRGCGM